MWPAGGARGTTDRTARGDRRPGPRAGRSKLPARGGALLWYILVQSIAVIWAHGSFQHCRVVKLAYELQNSCSIRLSQFSEFPQPVRIPYCRGARWLRMCQIASERGLDPFLSTSYRCLDGRFNRQIAHGRIRVYIGKGSKNSLTWKLQPPT